MWDQYSQRIPIATSVEYLIPLTRSLGDNNNFV